MDKRQRAGEGGGREVHEEDGRGKIPGRVAKREAGRRARLGPHPTLSPASTSPPSPYVTSPQRSFKGILKGAEKQSNLCAIWLEQTLGTPSPGPSGLYETLAYMSPLARSYDTRDTCFEGRRTRVRRFTLQRET